MQKNTCFTVSDEIAIISYFRRKTNNYLLLIENPFNIYIYTYINVLTKFFEVFVYRSG